MSESNTEAKDCIKKTIDLRNEGRIDEALLSARKAIKLAPEDANAWWQLALCQEQKDGLTSSINALEKTVEFAPYFAGGWCQLGFAYKKISILDKAIECYERALEEDDSHIHTLKLLDAALRDRDFAKDKNKRLKILASLYELKELDATTSFAYAFLLSEQKEYLASVKIYELCTQISNNPSAAYNNLGLNYQKLGRDLDAIDAYRKSVSLDKIREISKNNIEKLLPRLLNLRGRVSKKSPYLEQGSWYKHYINPFKLLGIEDPYEVAGDVKALQKYKKALYREIELEDGKVEWMPGLVTNKSTAISICEQLADSTQFEYHQAILENKSLCEFLSRGALEHFLVDPNSEEQVILTHELDREMLAWLGERFSEQFNFVFTRAIDNGDLEIIECMLDGRRWVLPEHEDRCFEGARRAIERLVEPLEKLAKNAREKINVQFTDVQNALTARKLNQILFLLPTDFTETQSLVYGALRTIAINVYNSRSDAEAAKAIIELGRFTKEKSPVISHQFEEDTKILEEEIQKEKAKEAHLTLGEKSIDITKAGVSYDGKNISTSDLIAARWGMVVTSNSPKIMRFSIAFRDRFDNDIEISWRSSQVEEQKKNWEKLVDATLHYLLDDLIANFKKRLDSGLKTMVGPLLVTSSGVEFEVEGWFLKKKIFCPWARLSTEVENGSLIVKDPSERKANVSLPLETVDNAITLYFVALNNS